MIFSHVESITREDGSGARAIIVYGCCPPSCCRDDEHHCFLGNAYECRMYLKIRAAKEAWFAHECLPGIYSHRKRHKHLHKKFRKSFIDKLIGVA